MRRPQPDFWETVTDPRHGTENGYKNLGCRCDRCREAHAEAVRASRIRRTMNPVPSHLHGTLNAYVNYACRCADCRRVANEYWRARRNGIRFTSRQVAA